MSICAPHVCRLPLAPVQDILSHLKMTWRRVHRLHADTGPVRAKRAGISNVESVGDLMLGRPYVSTYRQSAVAMSWSYHVAMSMRRGAAAF